MKFKSGESCAGKLCTGCQSCMIVCPSKSILYRIDSQGLEEVSTNIDSCIKCQKCEYVCPVINPPIQLYETSKRLLSFDSGTTLYDFVNKIFKGAPIELIILPTCDENPNNSIESYIHHLKYETNFDAKFDILNQNGATKIVFGRPCEINGLQNCLKKKSRNIYYLSTICSGKWTRTPTGFSEDCVVRESCRECNQSVFDVADIIFLPEDSTRTNKKSKFIVNNLILYQLLIENEDIEPIDLNYALDTKYSANIINTTAKMNSDTSNTPMTMNVPEKNREKSDIGLVGIYTVGNFGGAMTSYALYKMLKNMGYTVLLIERPLNAPHKPALSNIYSSDPYPECDKSKLFPDKDSMYALNSTCDSFIVGSDQMFHANLYINFAEWVTLDWVKDSKKKIAYAASFGHDEFTGSEDVRCKMSFFMKKFDYFSVREKSGINVAKKYFDVDSTWVLDPVFMCRPEDYSRFIVRKEGGYVSMYILDMNDEKKKIINYVLDKVEKPYQLFSEFAYKPDEFEKYCLTITPGTVEDRLSSIVNSDLVVTDSFHGLCFSIIFRKKFILIRNPLRGSTRFESLLSLLEINDRIIDTLDDLLLNPHIFESPDYNKIESILSEERGKSEKWIKNAINEPIMKPMSDYDLLREERLRRKSEITDLRRECNNLRMKLAQVSMIADKNLLRSETDIYIYLHMIKNAKNSAILVSVKDTPGQKINAGLASAFRLLGLKFDLIKRLASGYVALIEDGQLTYENVSAANTPSTYIGVLKNGDLVFLESCPLKGGNRSVIRIGNTDYSQNGRGINIVCFDKTENRIIDSVVFDTHTDKPGIPASRKKGV